VGLTNDSVSGYLADLVACIGHTPLLRLNRLSERLPHGVELFAKAEHLNPSGSVKDRAARAIVSHGLQTGELHPGKTILDATSGNTGIAYAMIGAALGYPVTLCLPANASAERKRLLRAYGARIVETDPLLATDGAQIEARRLADETPEQYFYADQYNNDANWRAHYLTTAAEIWEQTEGRVTHFLAGLGTSGTFVGTARRLKEFNPAVQAISMQPDLPLHGLEGLKHMETARVPGIYDDSLADAQVEVATPEARETARLLAKTEGLFVGISSGANVCAALRLANGLPNGSVVVTILCDGGSRYLNDSL
jgi:S-sulfo-L-cysteine synthase (O-acetyl-L-serine-dependent)